MAARRKSANTHLIQTLWSFVQLKNKWSFAVFLTLAEHRGAGRGLLRGVRQNRFQLHTVDPGSPPVLLLNFMAYWRITSIQRSLVFGATAFALEGYCCGVAHTRQARSL